MKNKYLIMYLGQGTADTLFTWQVFDSKDDAIYWLFYKWKKTHFTDPKDAHILINKSKEYKDGSVYDFHAKSKKHKYEFNHEIKLYEIEHFKKRKA